MIKRLLYLLLIVSNFAFAQNRFKLKKEIYGGVMASSTGNNSFWLRSNTWGTMPLTSSGGFSGISISKDYDSLYNFETKKLRSLDWSAGFHTHINLIKTPQIILSQGYLKARFKAFELSVGRYRKVYGLGTENNSLSSGSFIYSENATPLPKIELSIPNYVSVLGKGLISIKGNMAHGWFGKQTYTRNYFLHHKMLYGKIGKDKWRVSLEGGLNNEIQWGGYSELLKDDTLSSVNGYLPSDFNYFLGTAFPLPFIRKNFPAKIQLLYDNANYGGNVLGTADIAINIKLNKAAICMYRQIPYELGSLFTSLVNADDGIYGLSIDISSAKGILNKLVIENLHTTNQGGYRSGIARLLNLKDKHFGELHGYLNHGQYRDGWSNNDKNIGTPFIIPDTDFTIDQNKILSSYNQIKGMYVAMEGRLGFDVFIFKSSFMNYFPTGGAVLTDYAEKSQISLGLEYQKPINQFSKINFNLGYDNSGLLKQNIGCIVSWQRSWY